MIHAHSEVSCASVLGLVFSSAPQTKLHSLPMYLGGDRSLRRVETWSNTPPAGGSRALLSFNRRLVTHLLKFRVSTRLCAGWNAG